MLFAKFRKSSLAKGFVITVLGSGISKLILVVCIFYLANVLTKEAFGSFSFVRNTLNTIFVMCALNFSGLCTKFTAESLVSPQSTKRLFLLCGFTFLICFLFGIILCFMSDKVLLSIIGDKNIYAYFRLLGLFLPLFIVQPLVEGMLRGLKLFKLIGIIQIVTSLVFCLLIIGGALLYGLRGAVWGLIIYYFLYSLISAFFFFLKVKKALLPISNWRKLRDEIPSLFRIILPLFILSFIEAPANWIAQVIMSRYDSFSAIGGMTAILQIRNFAILIPTYYISTFTSFASSLNAAGNHSEYYNKFKSSEASLFFWCTFVGAFMVAIGIPILGLYGESYREDYMAYVIAMLGFPMIVLANLYKVNLIIKEHTFVMLLISILGTSSFVIILLFLLRMKIDSVQSYFYGQLGQSLIMLFISWSILKYDKNAKS